MLTGQAGAAPTAADELLHAVETFCRRPKSGRSGSELGDELILLRRTCDVLELEFSETAGEFAATDQYEQEGSVTVIDWIRHQCKMGGHAAADRVCVGEQLARLPLSSEALAEGQIGFAHLSLLAHTARALSAAPKRARLRGGQAAGEGSGEQPRPLPARVSACPPRRRPGGLRGRGAGPVGSAPAAAPQLP